MTTSFLRGNKDKEVIIMMMIDGGSVAKPHAENTNGMEDAIYE